MENSLDVQIILGVNTLRNSITKKGKDMYVQLIEAPIEKCVQKDIVHEVEHICPINTRIINNHIYRHTYQPRYTCCEENTCTNVQCGSCCQFR